MDMEENKDIHLIIKAPNQNIDDQTIHCNLEWSVIELKAHLAEVYPNNPDIQEQKLIYSGRLLRDHLQLKDILRHQEDQKSSPVHTVHLVCSRQNKPLTVPSKNYHSSQNVPQSSCSDSSDETQSTDSTDSSDSPSTRQRNLQNDTLEDNVASSSNPISSLQMPAMPSFPMNTDGSGQLSYIQQLYANYITQQTQNFGASSVWSSAVLPQLITYDVATQMAAYQQMYANYYAQCMQSLQSVPGSNNMPVVGIPQNAVPVADNQNDAAVPPPVAPNRNNVRMNAQGGPVLDDNDNAGNRDWLDYFYLWCRGFVLFSIVYFYSSPERLLLVVGLALMAFLYQEGWLLARMRNNRFAENHPRQQAVPNDNPNDTEDGPVQNQNANFNDRESQQENEIEAIMDADDPPHVQNPEVTNNQNPAWTFITSFFSSLIPEPPPPVNIN